MVLLMLMLASRKKASQMGSERSWRAEMMKITWYQLPPTTSTRKGSRVENDDNDTTATKQRRERSTLGRGMDGC